MTNKNSSTTPETKSESDLSLQNDKNSPSTEQAPIKLENYDVMDDESTTGISSR